MVNDRKRISCLLIDMLASTDNKYKISNYKDQEIENEAPCQWEPWV